MAAPARTAATALSSTEIVDDSPRQKTMSKLFGRFSFYVRQALSIIAERLLRQCPSFRLSFRRLIVSSSPLRPGKLSLMSVFSWSGATSS